MKEIENLRALKKMKKKNVFSLIFSSLAKNQKKEMKMKIIKKKRFAISSNFLSVENNKKKLLAIQLKEKWDEFSHCFSYEK